MKISRTTSETDEFIKQWYSSEEYIVAHTSGSTGIPKEIKLLKKDMIASASATNRFFNISSNSRLVCPLSASYIAGKMMIVRSLISGAELEMLLPSNKLEISGDISLLAIVPSQIESLVQNVSGNTGIENIIIGGAPITTEMEKMLESFPAHCYATYGMTETCSHVAIRKIGDPYFNALPGVEFDVDENQRLLIRLKYFSFESLLTNDIVELKSTNSFRWLGRFDNVVNSGGIKLFPEEIEREISEFVNGEFYLCGIPHPKWGEQLVMCVTDDTVVDIKRMESTISHIKVPKQIITLEKFEYTSNGKIKRIVPFQV